MARHRTSGNDPTAQNQIAPQDLDSVFKACAPDIKDNLPHLPLDKVKVEKVPDHDYPFGGSNDHFDTRILVGNINGKMHYVYAYLAKNTSEVKWMIYDNNRNEIPRAEINQVMKRTVREPAFEFADNAIKMTALVLYYFMKLKVVEMANVEDFLLAMEPLGTIAKDFKEGRKKKPSREATCSGFCGISSYA